MNFFRTILIGALALHLLRGQSLEIYSEFQRVDPFGNIVAADRAPRPREILSPAVPRNAFVSIHVVVSMPPGTNYFLYVVPNPLNACRVDLYKEHFVKTGDAWIPDPLAEVRRLPDFGVMPDPEEGIQGQTARVYLLDLWIPPNAPLRGFRLEVLLKVGYWIVRPMEVRIVPAHIPDLSRAKKKPLYAAPPGIEQGADAPAVAAVTAYVSGASQPRQSAPLTVRDIIRRNAIQDMALASMLDPKAAGPEALQKLWSASRPEDFGAESYLRIRDFLYSQARRQATTR